MLVRERPPLRLSISARTPNGRRWRWSDDEPNPANAPSGLSLSSVMPGGFENCSVTLPRKPGVDYSDLERLTTLTVQGAGGEIAGEYRLESAPRTSGSEMSVSPAAVGWQAHLADNKSAREIYVDQDLGSWREPSTQEKLRLLAASYSPQGPSVSADTTSGAPSLELGMDGAWASAGASAQGWYDAKGIALGALYHAWKKSSTVDSGDTHWHWEAGLSDQDNFTGASYDTSGDLRAAGPGSGTVTTSATRTFAFVSQWYDIAGGAENVHYATFWTRLPVYGAHGLTPRGTASATTAQGFYASDVVAHAVRKYAPLLALSEGANGSVTPTAFVIPQLAFLDPTTAAEIVSAANRYHLRDWAVWEGQRPAEPTFYYHDRGARGKRWRARISPAQLEETGPQIENLWNGILVRYQDVDGSTRTVGPTGSGASTESAYLLDPDPLNPANKLGIKRWDVLEMNGVSTPAGAVEVGRRFLTETAQLNTSGQAQLVGHVEDDHGVTHPAWRVRAGDTISFIDAADSSERRVVRTNYSDADKTNSIALDAPPEALESLLERLQAVLVPLGL